MSTLKKRVSSGTRTTPPPSPVSDPSRPAANDPIATRMVNSKIFIARPKKEFATSVGPRPIHPRFIEYSSIFNKGWIASTVPQGPAGKFASIFYWLSIFETLRRRNEARNSFGVSVRAGNWRFRGSRTARYDRGEQYQHQEESGRQDVCAQRLDPAQRNEAGDRCAAAADSTTHESTTESGCGDPATATAGGPSAKRREPGGTEGRYGGFAKRATATGRGDGEE